MPSLFALLGQTAKILGRNLVLLYPFLFFLIIVSFLLPQSGEVPTLETRWLTLFSVLFLLYTAFCAGWFNMMHAAVQENVAQPTPVAPGSEPPKPWDAFKLFGAFLPGVGRFFWAFTVGHLIQVVMVGLLILGVQWGMDHWLVGIEPLLKKMLALRSAGGSFQSVGIQQFLHTFSPQQLVLLNQFVMLVFGAFLTYGLFYLLTMFWAPLVVSRGLNPVKAYLKSMGRCFCDPLRILTLGLLYVSGLFILQWVTAMLSHPLMLVLAQFVQVIINLYFALLLFLYVAYWPGAEPVTDTAPLTTVDPSA